MKYFYLIKLLIYDCGGCCIKLSPAFIKLTILAVLFFIVYFCETNERKMNKRLIKFLEAENISQSQFADSIGVARASVSHIIAGRNKPGFEFIERTARQYPSLSLEWLITGKGRMYKDIDSGIFDAQADMELFQPSSEEVSPTDNQHITIDQPASSNKLRKISRITVFFEDGTFEEFR